MIGTGYVGLVSGVCLADFGHDVVCMDRLPEKIAMLERGEVPIYEPGLDAVMARNAASGRLRFTTDLESAEMIKYAANAFLATKVSFINEIAALCERVGADVKSVAKGMGLDGRIGSKFLRAGPGYGGSCFPKDTAALTRIGQEHAVPQRIVETVMEVNDATKRRMIDKVIDLCDGSVNGKTIAVLGVTFKPETDDMRDAPSLTIVPALVRRGAKLRVVDPHGRREGEALLPGVDWIKDPYAACAGADVVVILTEWNEFRALDLSRLAEGMTRPAMADLRNVYDKDAALQGGFAAYVGVGR